MFDAHKAHYTAYVRSEVITDTRAMGSKALGHEFRVHRKALNTQSINLPLIATCDWR